MIVCVQVIVCLFVRSAHMYMYIYIYWERESEIERYMHRHICIYIYIYIVRERDTHTHAHVCMCIHVCMYIYICIERERWRYIDIKQQLAIGLILLYHLLLITRFEGFIIHSLHPVLRISQSDGPVSTTLVYNLLHALDNPAPGLGSKHHRDV